MVCYTYKFLTAATTACVNGDDEALDILAAVPNLLLKVVEYISPSLVEHRSSVITASKSTGVPSSRPLTVAPAP